MIAKNDGSKVGSDRLKSTRILQISDLHFGAPFVRPVAEALLEKVCTLDFDAIVVSGDLTQRARREQFVEARDFLDRFPKVPRLIVPGNHDVPLYNVSRRLTDPHRFYREIIESNLNPTLKLPAATIVGLDSTAPRSSISNGRIHAWQLDHCTKIFDSAPPAAAQVVVAHHHFAPAPDNLRDSTMRKAKRAMATFSDLGVDLILGGHLHRAYIGNSLDFYPGKHRERGIVIAQCGTSTSRRGRGREQEKNTFNLVEIREHLLKVTHFMFFHETGFLPTSSHKFFRHTDTPTT